MRPSLRYYCVSNNKGSDFAYSVFICFKVMDEAGSFIFRTTVVQQRTDYFVFWRVAVVRCRRVRVEYPFVKFVEAGRGERSEVRDARWAVVLSRVPSCEFRTTLGRCEVRT